MGVGRAEEAHRLTAGVGMGKSQGLGRKKGMVRGLMSVSPWHPRTER